MDEVDKRIGSLYRSGRSKHRLKGKNPAAPAVRREAEEEEPQAGRAKFRTPFCPNWDKVRSDYGRES
jgi:hypothetical protein